jgi:hypothetical protein
MTRHSSARAIDRLDWLLLLLALAAAVFFRLWLQGHVPPGFEFDEAYESLEAHRLLTQPGYHPIYFTGNWGITPLEIYLTALAFRIVGEQTLAIRYVSAIAGILTIPALYLLTRMLFPLAAEAEPDLPRPLGASALARRWLPFSASLLLAVLPWHNAFSREGVEVILVPLWTTLALLFLWRGLTSRKWWPFVVSGLFWGSAFYTYRAAWVFPGVLALFLVYKVIQERGFLRRYGCQLLLLALTAGLLALPLALFAVRYPHLIVGRVASVSVSGAGGGSQALISGALANLVKVATVFVAGGSVPDGNLLYVRPPLPLVLALLLYLGMGVSIFRIRQPAYALLLIWFVWMWTPSILSNDAPNLHRMIGAAPGMAILIAVGAAWLLDLARAALRRVTPRPGAGSAFVGVALGGLLIYATIWSYQFFFVEWGRAQNLYFIFDVGLNEIGQYAASTPADTRLYYTPADAFTVAHLPVVWHVRDRQLSTFNGRHGLVLAPTGPQRALYLITLFQGDSWTLPALQRYYPAAQVAMESRDPYGRVHSLAFSVEPQTQPVIQPQSAVTAGFDGQIRLLGADLSAPEIRAGEVVTLTLYWQPETAPIPRDYTVFTHVLRPDHAADGSPVLAGQDSPPIGNSYPTSVWQPGEVIVDRHEITIPADAPPGDYPIEVGLYDPQAGGIRLMIVDAAGNPAGDSIVVDSVGIRAAGQ